MLVETKIDLSSYPDVVKLFDFLCKEDAELFPVGTWIAGGAARNIAHFMLGLICRDTFSDVMLPLDRRSVDFTNISPVRGDVDIFSPPDFPLPQAFHDDGFRSHVGFAHNYTLYHVHMQIQFVTQHEFRGATPAKTFDGFDFANCKYAVVRSAPAEFVLTYDQRALDFDRQRILHIDKNTAPLLGHRVSKYLLYRRLDDLDESSIMLLQEWLYKAAGGPEVWAEYYGQTKAAAISSIIRLDATGKVRINQEDFLLFLGKIMVFKKMPNYGKSIAVDWALERIRFPDNASLCKYLNTAS